MTAADLLRLLAVPAFGWVALRDYRTRRVPQWVWFPIAAGALILLIWDTIKVLGVGGFERRIFVIRVVLGIGIMVPLSIGFYLISAFGKADAKAFIALAILFPTYPTYQFSGITIPLVQSNIGVFSLTIVTNAAFVGIFYPVALAVRNLLAGKVGAKMFFYTTVPTEELDTKHGRIFVGGPPSGGFVVKIGYYISMLNVSKDRLDLDALRMYLRWRGLSLSALQENPAAFRNPATLPSDPEPPTDGAVAPDADPDPGGAPVAAFDGDGGAVSADGPPDDPWGAAAFLDAIDGSAYGTDPETLRAALDLIAEREAVWVSPGLPFLVPLFAGLLVAFTYGDVLFGLMLAAGIA